VVCPDIVRPGCPVNKKKEGVSMKKFIFVTPEGLSFKPNCDSPEPDYLDIHIYGFDQDSSVYNAIQDLMELSDNTNGDQPDLPFSVRVENNSRKNLWISEKKIKTGIAG
jgi:hypothetical protein